MPISMKSGFWVFCAVLLWVGASAPVFAGPPETVRGAAPVEIHRGKLKVTLDSRFPRVLSYEVQGRGRLLGARPDSPALIELNDRIFSAGDYVVACVSDETKVDYVMTITPLRLRLGLRFEVLPDELSLQLTSVEEQGEFKLVTLNFPDQELVRITASNPTSSMYRSEYSRRSWKDKEYMAGYDQPRPFFSSAIGEEDGELYPVLGNWVSASADGITATLATNIPYWKIRSQFLGYDARATDFAFWLGTYYYRLRGVVQPLLQARIALLTRDVNGDGRVDWMEAALWQHDLLRDPSPVFDPFTTFSYKVMNDWIDQPGVQPSTTFEETLQLIKRISIITGNAKQVAALTGWQNRGMDSGWPYFDRVNEALGGLTKLQWLVREVGKYNTTISYHINIDDSNANTPGFERSIAVLADGRNGKPYPWSIYYTGGPQVYRISHTKDLESGFFQERVGAMLQLLPKTNSIQLDTFRPYSISFGPDENIGIVDEVVSSVRIVDWFHQHGIAISSEGPVDGLYGVLDSTYHLFVRTDPFHILMTHGKIYGGGKASGVGQVLGWAPNHDFVARPLEHHEPKFDLHIRWDPPTDDQLRDMYYLGVLTQGYLTNKRLVWLGEEPGQMPVARNGAKQDLPQPTYVGRFADGTVSKVSSQEHWTVIDGGVTTVDDDYRAIPRGDSEIVLYSVKSRTAEVHIPSAWLQKRLLLTEVEAPARSIPVRLTPGASSVTVELRSRTAYRLQVSP
ncbi:MAG: hypothetical protein JST79_18300 [Acidobacteria bacterium]|nr:hypothetical protein [Acidobacteriota bacterium]